MAAKRRDSRDPLEIQIEGDLRTLLIRGLSHPDLHDLEALVQVARGLSTTGTDLEKIEAALALAVSDYDDEAKIETTHLWFGIRPKTRDTRKMSSAERHEAAWEYAREKDDRDRSFSYFRTHRARSRYEYLARRLFVRYTENKSNSSEASAVSDANKGAPTSDSKERQLHIGFTTQVKTLSAEQSVPRPQQRARGRRRGWLLRREDARDSPLASAGSKERVVAIVKTRLGTYGITKRRVHIRLEFVEYCHLLSIDLIVIGIGLAMIAAITMLVIYFFL
jgi:hypothetical protein